MRFIKRLFRYAITILCLGVIAFSFVKLNNSRQKTEYLEHLNDVVCIIDNEELLYQDLAFYILYEERVVEEQARIYNHDSPKDYWNIHSNDTFIQLEAKDAILGMAIHDRLFYNLAVERGFDKLTSEEEEQLVFSTTDFWEDLLDEQWERLPCSEEEINLQIRKAAIAEKYQNYLGETEGPSVAAYKYDGFYYEQIKEQHQIQMNKKLWENFVVGDITIYHGSLNFINGLTNEDKKKNEE